MFMSINLKKVKVWYIGILLLSVAFAFMINWSIQTVSFGYFVIFVSFVYNLLFLVYAQDEKNEKIEKYTWRNLKVDVILFSILTIVFIVTSPLFFAKKYASVVKEKDINSSNIIISNPDKIRTVTKDMAISKANKILGVKIDGVELSTQYELGNGNIILYKGKEYWIFPLAYSGFFKWLFNDKIPGYILVSATEPNAEPKFVKKEYVETPSAYFFSNLNKKIYLKTIGAPVRIHFEIDENGEPYWIASVLKYKYLVNMFYVNKVYIINAKTGEFKECSLDKDNLPKWVDKVIPEDLASDYITYWGKYRNGFWNSLFTQKNIVVPTQEGNSSTGLWLIENKKTSLGWFTGMTSLNKKDNSLTTAVILDPKSYTLYKIEDAFGITDEEGAIQAVSSKLGANALKWKPSIAIPFVLNKKWYWSVSIEDVHTHIYQKAAAVEGKRIDKVVFGENVHQIFQKLSQQNIFTVYNKKVQSKNLNKKELILRKINKMEKEIKELKELVKSL
jgi:hypothetical protein